MKKVLSALMALLMLTAILPAASFAEDKINNYTVTDTISAQLKGGVLTVSGTGEMPDLRHPDHNWETQAPAPWAGENRQITSVVVESGITRIGSYAFAGTNAESIILPDTVTEIGKGAFGFCYQLKSMSLPQGVTEIAEELFIGDYNLKNLEMGSAVTRICRRAFYDAYPAEFCFPANLTELDKNALERAAFTSIAVDKDNPLYSSKNGALCSKDGKKLIMVPTGLEAEVFDCRGIEEIEREAFYGAKNIRSVDLTGVKIIGDQAFYRSGLVSVTIPDSVEEMGDYVFSSCEKLAEIDIGGGLSEIGLGCFESCPIEELVIPENIKII